MTSVSPSKVHSQPFRHDLLGLRRRMLGVSQVELAERAGIGQGTLSKVEQGLREATSDMAESLAKALDCPVSFFHQVEREYGPPMSAHPAFRKKASVGQKVLDRVIAEFNVRIGHVRTLLRTVEFEPELQLPRYDIDDFSGGAEEVAANVRRAWYMPRGPVPSLTEYLERAGCLVVHCDMEAAKIDGASYRLPGLPPIIFLNRHQPADRMRFSLAHEAGHLVLHAYPTPNMEQEADVFASALLMPSSDIGPELDGLTLAKAAYMKPVWKVSMAALIVRATALKRLDKSKAEYMWRMMSMKGYRTREPASLDFAQEKPTLMEALLQNLTNDMSYSETDLAQTLHLHYQELAQMYSLPMSTGLRRIK